MSIIQMEVFWKGLIIGIIFGVPAGAVGAMTIQRTLSRGFRTGLISGIGSSLADMIYAAVGVFGITQISDLVLSYRSIIQVIGGILIGIIAFTVFKSGPKRTVEQDDSGLGLVGIFMSSFTVDLMNPGSIAAFLLAFSTFHITDELSVSGCLILLLGVLIGSVSWWFLLSGIVSVFRRKITDRIYRILNNILGILLIGFAAFMLIDGLLISG